MLLGMTVYHCPADGTRSEITALTWCCPVCRGPWDLDFTPARGVAPNALSTRVDSLWRYKEFLPLAARAAADGPGVFYASHVYNPYFLHGTKTYVYELWEDLGGRLPDALAVPVGNGTLLLGAALATAELHALGLIETRPRLIAVQAEAVAPPAARGFYVETTGVARAPRGPGRAGGTRGTCSIRRSGGHPVRGPCVP